MKHIINTEAPTASFMHHLAGALQGATGLDGPIALAVAGFGVVAACVAAAAVLGVVLGDRPPR